MCGISMNLDSVTCIYLFSIYVWDTQQRLQTMNMTCSCPQWVLHLVGEIKCKTKHGIKAIWWIKSGGKSMCYMKQLRKTEPLSKQGREVLLKDKASQLCQKKGGGIKTWYKTTMKFPKFRLVCDKKSWEEEYLRTI